jgi:glycosyltransferase involved in cell wall biosynthesis
MVMDDIFTSLPDSADVASVDRPIRVCFLIDRLLPGGTETQLIALIRNLDPARIQPYLCLLDGEDRVSRWMEPPQCTVLRLGLRSLKRPRSLVKAWQFARFLRREQIDVLQVYFPDSTYFGVPVARLAGVPYVLRTRNNLNHWMTPRDRFLGRLYNWLVTATLTNCEAARQAVLADEKSAPESVIVLENGVDLGPFLEVARVDPSRPKKARRVGVVANLRAVKGLEIFVEAAAQLAAELPGVHFQIAGEGELRPHLEHRIRELGLTERFTLPGSLRNIPAFLETLDVAVLCSLAEGMSNAVLEYMAAGRPVVATAVGHTVHVIDDGVHGLLVPPGNAPALAHAVRRLVRDPALAARLGEAARRRARDRYSREVMVRNFEDFYQNLVTHGRICWSREDSRDAFASSRCPGPGRNGLDGAFVVARLAGGRGPDGGRDF